MGRVKPEINTNDFLASINLGEHFIPRLGIHMRPNDDGTHHLSFEISDRVADVALIGLLTDMTAGQAIIAARAPCEAATTHIEVHAVTNLVGPGTIVGRTRVLATSKRRGVMETIFELNGGYAFAHSTFNIREGQLRPMSIDRPKAEAFTEPLGSFVGVERTVEGSRLELSSRVANHTGALQGGITIALAEGAALGQLAEGELLEGVSIHYLHPVRGGVATAKAVRYGRSITVNVRTDGEKKELARLTFTVA